MHTEATLVGEVRKDLGKLATRRLRREGLVPGIIYGHEEEPQPVQFRSETLLPLIRSGAHVVNLEIGGSSNQVMLQDVQWDTFGRAIQHIDLLRFDPNKTIEVEVTLELRGTAPGAVAGGVLEYGMRTITVECLAHDVPDHIIVKIGELQVNQAIHIRELDVPAGVTFKHDPEAIVVRVVQVQLSEELEAGLAGPAQPELIGRKPTDEEAAAEEKKK